MIPVTAEQPSIGSIASSCRGALGWAALFSGAVNALMLTGPLFMLQVYDRVIAARSLPTLQALLVLVVLLYAVQCGLEIIRGRIFARLGHRLEAGLEGAVFDAGLASGCAPVLPPASAHRSPPLFHDLEQIRAYLASGGPGILFDLPWVPLYALVLFAMHWSLGALGAASVGGLALLTVLADGLGRGHQRRAAAMAGEAESWAVRAHRSAETLLPLGMAEHVGALWRAARRAAARANLAGADIAGALGAVSRFARSVLQSLVLGLGAYLVIMQEVTPGVMVASSIMLGRALAPVDGAIRHWRPLVAARQGYIRLAAALAPRSQNTSPSSARRPVCLAVHSTTLPAPRLTLAVEQLSVAPAGGRDLTLHDVGFQLAGGDALGVIGPSGAGKSTLGRALVGLEWPVRGAVRLDGASLDQWGRALGRHLGYMPQITELFPGTVAQNIARFDPSATSDEILAAAEAAGAGAFVRRLPGGFDTALGEGGAPLSVGQRQRLALARALFREPFLVVLDEPNANLDGEGETALQRSIQGVRARGGIAVVVAQRPSVLTQVNLVLVIAGGQLKAFGPREDVLRRVMSGGAAASSPAAPVLGSVAAAAG